MLFFHFLCLSIWTAVQAGDYSGIFCLPFPLRYGQHEPKRKRVFAKGETITYSCGNNYSLFGKATAKCIGLYKWDTKYPSCKRRPRCKRPKLNPGVHILNIRNSHYYNIGDVIEYQCGFGYQAEGNLKQYCTEEGRWSGDVPRCTRNFCHAPRGNKLKIEPYKPTYLVHESVYFYCEHGYDLDGTNVATCLLGGKWDQLPKCTVLCSPPPEPEGGYYFPSQESYTFGEEITYFCLNSRSLLGPTIRKCNIHGDWDPFTPPKCKVPSCGVPIRSYLGQNRIFYLPKQTYYPIGSLVRLSCDSRYRLVGPRLLHCQANARWSSFIRPRCLPPTCPRPTIPAHGYITPTKQYYREDEAVWFKCNETYEIKGAKDIHCNKGGVWSHAFPTCQVPQCPAPPQGIQYAEFEPIRKVYQVGIRIIFKCQEYTALKGERSIRCMSGGHWSHQFPTCQSGCPAPIPPFEGYITPQQSVYYVNQQVWYKCPPGYRTNKDSDIICQDNHQWSQTDIQCVTERSCKSKCFETVSGASCLCDVKCIERGDCCSDYFEICYQESNYHY